MAESAFDPTNIAASFGLLDPINAVKPLTEGIAAAPLANLNPFGSDIVPAINPNLPSATARFSKKWDSIPDELKQDRTIRAMIAFDAGRVAQGQSPLSMAETANAIAAAKSGSPTTAHRQSNPWNPLNMVGNALRDVKDIALAIPRLGPSLVRETQAVTAKVMGLKEGETLRAGPFAYTVQKEADPGNPISRFLELPGVRMVPLAHEVDVLAQGKPGELARHPVQTVLDLLPVVGKAAELTSAAKVAKAGAEAAEASRAARAAEGGLMGAITTAEERMAIQAGKRPITTALTKTVADDGTLVPNRFGELVGKARGAPVVEDIIRSMGGEARSLTRLEEEAAARTNFLTDDTAPLPRGFDNLDPEVQNIIRTNRAGSAIARDFADLTPEAKTRVFEAIEMDDVGSLADRELELAGRIRDARAQLDALKVDTRGMVASNGELYLPEQAQRIAQADYLANQARSLANLRASITNPMRTPDAALYDAGVLSDAPVLRQPAGQRPDILSRPADAFTPRRLVQRIKGHLYEAEAAGANIDPLRDLLRDAERVVSNPAAYEAAMGKFRVALANHMDAVREALANGSDADRVVAAERAAIQDAVDAAVQLHTDRLTRLEAIEAQAQQAHDAARYKLAQGAPGASAQELATHLRLKAAREAVSEGRARAAAELEDTKAALADRLESAEAQYMNSRSNFLRPAPSVDDIRASLRPHLKDPMVRAMHEALGAGDLRLARDVANKIMKRNQFVVPPVADAIDAIRRQIAREDFVSSRQGLGGIDDRIASRLEARAAKVRESTIPTRFRATMARDLSELPEDVRTKITNEAATRAGEVLTAANNDPAFHAAVTEAIVARNFDSIPGLADLTATTAAEIQQSWQTLRDLGIDPQYLHHVTPAGAREVVNMRVTDFPKSITSLRERVTDFSPHIKDPVIAIQHEAWEYMRKVVAEDMAEAIGGSYGRKLADIREMYTARAEAMQAAGQLDPRIPIESVIEDMVKRDYVPYSPSALGYKWGGKRLAALEDGQIMLPKNTAKAVEKMFAAPTVNAYTKLVNPTLGAFRTSVLALSPRFLFNNVFGGAITSMMQSGVGVWRGLPEALKMMRAGDVPELLRGSMGGAARDINQFGLGYLQGRTLGRMVREVEESRFRQIAERTGRPLEWVKTKSYGINSWFDNAYRLMNYVYGKKMGLTDPGAVELARGVLQNMGDMTPFERNVLRNVAPFYSFTQHMVRFALRFPFDHPFRAYTLNTVARIEMEDMGSGLPDTMLNFLFFGHKDKDGNQLAVNVGSINPFRDIANMGTLSGFLSAANPVIATAAEQIGVKNGQAELYPDLVFDPSTGQFRGNHPNFISSLAGNVIPQTRLLGALFTSRNQFAAQYARDPHAAMASLYSGLGLPAIVTTKNEDQERFKYELKLEQAMEEAWKQALKTGDYSYAETFPGLRDRIAAVKRLAASPAGAAFRVGG